MRIKDWISRDVLGVIVRSENPRASVKFAKDYFKGKEINALEIGVCEGYNALSILQNLPIKRLYLIDPFKEYPELKDDNPPLLWAEKKAHNKLFEYDNKIIWIKKTSEEASKEIPDNLDFVYLDGNHSYEYVKKDLETYWNNLKQGGILAGHDIENGFSNKGVVKALFEFCLENDLLFKLNIQCPD